MKNVVAMKEPVSRIVCDKSDDGIVATFCRYRVLQDASLEFPWYVP